MNISPVNSLSFRAKWSVKRDRLLDSEGKTGIIVNHIEKKLSSKETSDFINRLPENGNERIEFDYHASDDTIEPVLALEYYQNETNKKTSPIKEEDLICYFQQNDSRKEINKKIDNWLHTIGKYYNCY